VEVLRKARENGIVTFGIFLGEVGNPDKMNELYGYGNWVAIQSLGDMPKSVAQRLSNIFSSIR
jgi:hypothetical protein